MSTVTDTLGTPTIGTPQDTQQANVRLLNAKRYGLSEADLSQFMELMTSLRNPKPNEAEGSEDAKGTNADVTTLSDTDYITSYIRQRITDRLSSAMGRDNTMGVPPPRHANQSPRPDLRNGRHPAQTIERPVRPAQHAF